jgi:GDP-4-dehydro-6-deoxy-D-mannose reductase
MPPTVITGATGFAGGHLLDRLAARAEIVAWHRPGKPAPRQSRDLTWQPVDILDREAVSRAIADVRPSRIYHVAGAPRVDTAPDGIVPQLRTNVMGTHHLLEAVRRLDLPCRMLVVSSGLVYHPRDSPLSEDAACIPANPYGVSKLAQDQHSLNAWKDDGMDVVVARPFTHIGPRQDPAFSISSFARQIALIEAGGATSPIRVGNLDPRRDLTDVRDVVAAYEQLMENGAAGRPYNVCSGVPLRIGDVLEQLIALSTVPVEVVVDPERLRSADPAALIGDPSRIQREIGWRPRLSLADTLRDTLDWWRQEGVRPGSIRSH